MVSLLNIAAHAIIMTPMSMRCLGVLTHHETAPPCFPYDCVHVEFDMMAA